MAHLRFSWLLVFSFTLMFSQSALAVTSAELYRPSPLRFGKFEARIQFVGGDGVVGAFFLWKDGSEGANVYWNELDFEKLGGDCDLQTNSIYGLPESNHDEDGYGLSDLCTGYHTYSYEWTPDYIAWAVDGVELRRDTGEAAAVYSENAPEGLQMRFNVWPGNSDFGGNFDEAILPVYQFIEWAQYSEYTPGAGDDGSDFTFSWREEFDATPSDWSRGSWDSPFALSRHGPANVVFKEGVAVLALTTDNAPGYTGSPPRDGDLASGGTGGSGGALAGTGGLTAGTGGVVAATGGTAMPPTGQTGANGCSQAPLPTRPGRFGIVGALVLALAVAVRKQRPRTRNVAGVSL